jgi:hypothetical protein
MTIVTFRKEILSLSKKHFTNAKLKERFGTSMDVMDYQDRDDEMG